MLPEITLSVCKTSTDRFLELRMERIEASFHKGAEWMSIATSLKNFVILDLYSKCEDYPYLLESVATREDAQVLKLEIKLNPLEGNADMALMVKNEARFYIIANMVTLFAVKSMLQEATAEEGYDFTFYKSAAAKKAAEYIQTGE